MKTRTGIAISGVIAVAVGGAMFAGWNGFKPDRSRLAAGDYAIAVDNGGQVIAAHRDDRGDTVGDLWAGIVQAGSRCVVIEDAGDVLDSGREVHVRFIDEKPPWSATIRREYLRPSR